MKKFNLALAAALLLCAGSSIYGQTDMLTQHNDLGRTGWNSQETRLNSKNVKAGSFAKLYSYAVDDQVYAQPLVASGVNIPGIGIRNLVYVATVNNTVYAFDGDSARAAGPYWKINLSPAGTRPPNNTDMLPPPCGGSYHDFSGKIGIVGTPVIDKTAGTLYLVSRSVNTTGTKIYAQYLHALNITTGTERAGSPVLITAQVNGNGDGSVGGVISFDPQKQNQRPGLLLLNGIVYIGYASHCDWTPYHGWLMGYDATTLQQKLVYNSTPEGSDGGIWMSGAAPSADASGNIYLATGNGSVGTAGNPSDPVNRGEGAVKLIPSGSGLTVGTFFTPYNYSDLDAADLDFGVTQMLLIPGTQFLVMASKEGKLYSANRNNLGGYHAAYDSVLQTINLGATAHLHSSLAYYQGTTHEFVYTWSENAVLKALPVDRVHDTLDILHEVISGIQGPVGNSGASMSVSSNGAVDSTAILWASHANGCDANQSVCPGVLRAIDANDVTHELWNSTQNAGDNVGNYAKFVCPTVANGRVYLSTFSNLIDVYGLTGVTPDTCNSPNIALNSPVTASSAITGHAAAAAVDGNVATFWASNSTNTEYIYTDLAAKYDLCRVVLQWQSNAAVNYTIDVSDDAQTWTTAVSVTGNNPAILTNSVNLHASGRYVRMQGINPGQTGGNYSILEMQVYGTPTVICAPPTGLTTSNRSSNNVLASWQPAGNATGYTIEYRNVSVNTWNVLTSNADTVLLPALSCGYDYLYQVASTCPGGLTSAYTVPIGFSAPACSANCPPLPTRWTSSDIGNVGVAGSACYLAPFVVYITQGSGSDIGGTADAFRYAYFTVVGNDQIIERVASLDAVNTANKAGLMIRESTDPGSRNAFIALTSGQGGTFQYRSATGGATSGSFNSAPKPPYWVRLLKTGSVYTGYLSADGSNWSQVGSSVDLGFGSGSNPVYAGLAITSHNNTLTSQALIDNFSQSTPLPVILLSFTGRNIGDQYIALQWETGTESNNDHFEIDRSHDGVRFDSIATVRAAGTGNSSSPQQYAAEDRNPGSGINFYRLKQVDRDGRFVVSPMIQVQFGKNSTPILFPNPAGDIFNIAAGQDPITEVNILDISGRRIRRVINSAGSSTLSFSCAGLNAGIYIVQIKTGVQNYIQKLIKK